MSKREEGEPGLPVGLVDVAGEPALPEGLSTMPAEPALPEGLGEASDEPALPIGLAPPDSERAVSPSPDVQVEAAGTPSATPLAEPGMPAQWNTWGELRGGGRLVGDPSQSALSLAELRVHLDLAQGFQAWSTTLRLVVDGVVDSLSSQLLPQLETGHGVVDLRTASITFTPAEWLDVRLGRQILTWGTGDLLFINDLFPKDWMAFLIGRDVDYLKAPSDAVKFAMFTAWFALDLVLTPRFDTDRLPLRERLSSYEPSLGRIAGKDAPFDLERRNRWGRDGELAARLHRAVGAWELAMYGYYGFWKSPAGFDPISGRARFPRLAAYGASLRGPVLGGIAAGEFGYYDSLDDRAGEDPLTRNSEARALFGYEHPLWRNITLGIQYYAELILDHGGYTRGLPAGAPVMDRVRHVLTSRLHILALRERLEVSLFVFVSPSDRDGYLRPRVSYALSDQWKATLGANLLTGPDDHTFFGQLKRNTNVYAALRFSH